MVLTESGLGTKKFTLFGGWRLGFTGNLLSANECLHHIRERDSVNNDKNQHEIEARL